jgi:hypothetical protein
MAQQSHDETIRDVRATNTRKGLIVEVTLHYLEEKRGQKVLKGREKVGQYAFVRLDRDNLADNVLGEVPDTDGPVMAYIGSGFGKHYYTSHSRDGLPVDVYEQLSERGATLLENVDGGWHRWGGRPEFSEDYIDFSEAEAVDMAAIIEERRNDD